MFDISVGHHFTLPISSTNQMQKPDKQGSHQWALLTNNFVILRIYSIIQSVQLQLICPYHVSNYMPVTICFSCELLGVLLQVFLKQKQVFYIISLISLPDPDTLLNILRLLFLIFLWISSKQDLLPLLWMRHYNSHKLSNTQNIYKKQRKNVPKRSWCHSSFFQDTFRIVCRASLRKSF